MPILWLRVAVSITCSRCRVPGNPALRFPWELLRVAQGDPGASRRLSRNRPDVPGHGDSDRPRNGYDTATVAKRLDLFLSELG